jgi:hypothetical protein
MKVLRVLAAWVLLHIVAATLRLFGLKFWTHLLQRASARLRSATGTYVDAARWGWSVLRAESLSLFRFRWNQNCLSRSITLCMLLTLAGIPCALRIGVRLNGVENLQSHAWVEVDGRPVAERASLVELTPLQTVFNRVP